MLSPNRYSGVKFSVFNKPRMIRTLPGDEERMIFSADGTQRLLFIQVPDAKQVKNRVHLDLKPTNGTRDEELARLLALGVEEVDDLRNPDGTGWVILADPEGNEFCILRSDAERETLERDVNL